MRSGSSGYNVNTSRIIGGVIGGIAGAIILLLLAIFFLRWRKRRLQTSWVVSDGQSNDRASARSSNISLAAAAARLSTPMRLFSPWRDSSQPAGAEAAPSSERGFQKISGRKLPSIFRTGGDGFDVVPGPSSSQPISPRIPSPTEGIGEGIPVIRPSPARTPVASSPSRSIAHQPTWVTHGTAISPPPDPVGRSHPHTDGSRGSRFTESI